MISFIQLYHISTYLGIGIVQGLNVMVYIYIYTMRSVSGKALIHS